jgi:hypothetical protein
MVTLHGNNITESSPAVLPILCNSMDILSCICISLWCTGHLTITARLSLSPCTCMVTPELGTLRIPKTKQRLCASSHCEMVDGNDSSPIVAVESHCCTKHYRDVVWHILYHLDIGLTSAWSSWVGCTHHCMDLWALPVLQRMLCSP